jgi:hypothetical protein
VKNRDYWRCEMEREGALKMDASGSSCRCVLNGYGLRLVRERLDLPLSWPTSISSARRIAS